MWRTSTLITLAIALAGCPTTPELSDALSGDAAATEPLCPRDPLTGQRDRACLALVWLQLQNAPDSDGDGLPDALDDVEGPDNDDDGIANAEDPDVDGDGMPNSNDNDIDGDGLFNDNDDDIDDDGEENESDADDDGDGVSDRWDLNDDGDRDPDDEDADEDDDGGGDDNEVDTLTNLLEKLRTGEITELERGQIAKEISNRLKDITLQGEFQILLVRVVQLGTEPDRANQGVAGAPAGVNAIDAVYTQLSESLAEVRATLPDPEASIPQEKLQQVISEFQGRTRFMVDLARKLPSLSFFRLGQNVSELGKVFGKAKLDEIRAALADHLDASSADTPAEEHRQLDYLVKGAAGIGSSFREAKVSDVLDAVERLRDRALASDGDDNEKFAKFESLVNRMNELSEGDLPMTIDDAVEQVEQEDDADDDDDDSDDDDGSDDNGNDNGD